MLELISCSSNPIRRKGACRSCTFHSLVNRPALLLLPLQRSGDFTHLLLTTIHPYHSLTASGQSPLHIGVTASSFSGFILYRTRILSYWPHRFRTTLFRSRSDLVYPLATCRPTTLWKQVETSSRIAPTHTSSAVLNILLSSPQTKLSTGPSATPPLSFRHGPLISRPAIR